MAGESYPYQSMYPVKFLIDTCYQLSTWYQKNTACSKFFKEIRLLAGKLLHYRTQNQFLNQNSQKM